MKIPMRPAAARSGWACVLLVTNLSVTVLAQDPSLIAHYSFQGNAADISGHQPDGILRGPAPCADRHGNPNGAYCFDGNDYIDIGPGVKPYFPITVIAWFRGAGSLIANDRVDDSGYRYGFLINTYSDVARVHFHSGYAVSGNRNAQKANGFSGFQQNTWYFFAVVMRSVSKTDWYINGKHYSGVKDQDGTGTGMTYSPRHQNYHGTIGIPLPRGYVYFQGAIDELLVFSRALSEAEVWQYCDFKPKINREPESANVVNGSMAEFTLAVTAAMSFNYQWYHKVGDTVRALQDQSDSTLRIQPALPFFEGQYYATASNAWGVATSAFARLHVSEIIPQVEDLVTLRYPTSYGKDYEVRSAAVVSTPRNQWKPETSLVPGSGSTLASNLKPAGSIQFFEVRETEGTMPPAPECVVTSEAPLTITAQPADQIVPDGGTARFTVVVSGPNPVNLQWWGLGVPLADDAHFFSGSKSCALTIRNVTRLLAGDYKVVISDGSSQLASASAALRVGDFATDVSLGSWVSFPAEEGKKYQIEYSTDLDEPLWHPLGECIEASAPMVRMPFPAGSPSEVHFRAKSCPE